MKYLTENYWEEFWKEVKQKEEIKIVKDGEKFEDLIEELLDLMYQGKGISWKKTKATHDGNKDYVGCKEGIPFIWAECKNYKASISLKVIAPTLVMAELGEIQKILVFSYSAINPQTKEKLLHYANKREKTIFYFDDINLENLLFQYRTKLFPKYFKTYSNVDVPLNKIAPYVFSCSMPGLHYNNAEEIGISTFHIKLNELIFTGIGIINNNYIDNLEVEISFAKYNDLEYLEVLDSSVDNSLRYNWKKHIELVPGEARFLKLYFKPVRFKKEYYLPSIKLDFKDHHIENKTIKFKPITCSCLFCTPFIGSKYINALTNLEEETVNKGKMSLALINGRSGVGKSRFLYESLSIYARNHYQILNFTMNSLSKDSFMMMQEIISFIYNITPDMVFEALKEYVEEDSIYSAEQITVIKILQTLLNDQQLDFIELLKHNKFLIFDKILSQKNVIVIDNIQFAEPFFVEFLYDLSIYAKNYQRNTQFVLLLSCNEDYHCHESIKKMRILAEELKKSNNLNVFIHEIEGMNTGKLSLGFLKELIHVDNETASSYLEMIVERANHVPKHIENIVEYLSKKQAIRVENNYFVILEPKRFYSLIKNMPETFSDIFKQRYLLFLKNEEFSEERVELTIAAIHFWGHITAEQIQLFHLDMEIINTLKEYGFIDKIDYNSYQFNHDLYEQFFMEYYELEEIFIRYIIANNFISQKGFLPWQNILISINQSLIPEEIVDNIVIKWYQVKNSVPYKLKNYFYHQTLHYLTIHHHVVKDFDKYMRCAREMCLEVKNALGSDVSKSLFEKVYNAVLHKSIQIREESLGYQQFIYEYSENLLQNNDSSVLEIYRERIEYLEQEPDKNYELLARLHNRRYVYYKHTKHEAVVHKHMEKSLELCEKYNLLGMQIENLYDEGNYYQFVPEKKKRLIECWSQGYQLFEQNEKSLEYLTLNSLKKRIQLDLLCNNYDEIEFRIENAFDYIETGRYNEQTLFFNASLYYLKSIYGLMSQKLSASEVQETLDTAAKYYVLKNNEKPYVIHLLYAKLAFNKKEFQEMLLHYDNALQKLPKKHYHLKRIQRIIVEDCQYKIGLIKNEKPDILLNYTAISTLLKSKCQKIENFPKEELMNFLRTFRSISNITDESRKDGYIY